MNFLIASDSIVYKSSLTAFNFSFVRHLLTGSIQLIKCMIFILMSLSYVNLIP